MAKISTLSSLEATEEVKIPRTVLAWLNTCPALPAGAIRYQTLPIGRPGMCMTSTRANYVAKRYIYGGYLAHFHILLVYRVQPGDSGNLRLQAEEALNAIGDWAVDPKNQAPLFGDTCNMRNVYINYRANLVSAWDNGDEDHSITIAVSYEIIK